jgi:hypothetical protein
MSRKPGKKNSKLETRWMDAWDRANADNPLVPMLGPRTAVEYAAFRCLLRDVGGILTCDHPASYGIPVVVVDGRAYGPGDTGELQRLRNVRAEVAA